eukprot:TRINITY_DN20604_c0_g2_i1.p1 TRINITY_DN20604_c0_g2~~TRINITY_DN20604_c0_g2_i1.p1  ORF type:complete len:755 (-),score=167.27 TRINITY_DN20604_c0_g2_i1:175-2439(-)
MGASQLSGICHTCQPDVCCDSENLVDEDGGSASLKTLGLQGFNVLAFGPGSSPAGQVFEETLRDLSRKDRNLLIFCSTSCLTAVRWLVQQGASKEVADSNGTTCLHVACRSGALPVVCEVMNFHPMLEAVDVCGWTPLHIAAHMGRAEAVLRLLQAAANPNVRNAAGQTPAQLCLDRATREVLQAATENAVLPSSRHLASLGSTEVVEADEEWPMDAHDFLQAREVQQDSVGVPSQCERELFFVTPKPAIREVKSFRKPLSQLVVTIFNLSPSCGLAFSVACGLSEGYTAAARSLLHSGGASRNKIGNFLGQDFSLCLLVRFGVLDSLPLLHTGVISGLRLTLSHMQLPEDPQKVERLISATALVWWRKHRAYYASNAIQPHGEISVAPIQNSNNKEFVGLGLLQYLSSSQVLSQLMYSAVMLHWTIHGDGTGEKGEITFEEWMQLNRGLEDISKDVPELVQRPVFETLQRHFMPELVLAMPGRSRGLEFAEPVMTLVTDDADDAEDNDFEEYVEDKLKVVDGTELAVSDEKQEPMHSAAFVSGSALRNMAQVEGWLQLIGAGPPLAQGSDQFGSEALGTYQLEASIDGLLSSSMLRNSDRSINNEMAPPGPPEQGWVWASLCSILLLFSLAPPGTPCGDSDDTVAPHALVDIRHLQVVQVSREGQSFGLHKVPPKDLEGPMSARQGADSSASLQVPMILFLADGRWQDWNLPPLRIKTTTDDQLAKWTSLLSRRADPKTSDATRAIDADGKKL